MSTAVLKTPKELRKKSTAETPDPEALYEIVDGEEVQLPQMSMKSGALASIRS